METITVKYNKNTVFEDVEKVIKYPCSIRLKCMNDKQVRDFVWNIGSWQYESNTYLEFALGLDSEYFQEDVGKRDWIVEINHFTVDEYIDIVKKERGTVLNGLATDEYIREYYQKLIKDNK